MRYITKLALLIAALALSAAPALANESSPAPQGNQGLHKGQGKSHFPESTPGPGAALPAKAKAYGFYCRGQSKEHVKGEKGTPFSQCVTAMAKLANGKTDNPSKACASESRKHVKGEKGTPFSRCVSAAAKLQHDQDQSGDDESAA
jgi:hypothetical protein